MGYVIAFAKEIIVKEIRSTGLALLLTLTLAGCSKNVSQPGGGATKGQVKAPGTPSPGQFTRPTGRPPMGSMGGTRRATPKLRWKLPVGWQAVQPKSRIRRAEIVLPKAKGAEEARLAVFHFPGQGGARMANIQRWVGQFKSPDGKKSEPKVEKRKVGELAVTTVLHKGTYMQSMGGSMMKRGPVKERPGFALLAAIVETPSGPWFFKATGPAPTIEQNRPAFDSFLNSLTIAAPAAKKAPAPAAKKAPAPAAKKAPAPAAKKVPAPAAKKAKPAATAPKKAGS